YAISLIPFRGDFPLLTLMTNLLGAVLIGFIVGAVQASALPQTAVMFLKTGFCGGFTTFSTFSLEAYQLAEGGEKAAAVLYIVLSVAGCIAGVWCGMKLAARCGFEKAGD
ncbi:MAG: fluoride efflux transporter CrcB, partial [Ruminococcus sp.]|nr:fluoride efflux transporter CrcB [Ruminococcus sp.]